MDMFKVFRNVAGLQENEDIVPVVPEIKQGDSPKPKETELEPTDPSLKKVDGDVLQETQVAERKVEALGDLLEAAKGCESLLYGTTFNAQAFGSMYNVGMRACKTLGLPVKVLGSEALTTNDGRLECVDAVQHLLDAVKAVNATAFNSGCNE